jgi:uncharacterized protein (DUF427 family)
MWRYTGAKRPDFADPPSQGQESVWDYPRPPRVELDARRVEVVHGGITIADTRSAYRVLETASPPTFYMPADAVAMEYLEASPRSSMCEWKGRAAYWSFRAGNELLEDVAWSYPEPYPGFERIAGYLSFYPARLECTVDGVRVRPQPGGFYGGWVTPEIVGPFKGEPGTGWW